MHKILFKYCYSIRHEFTKYFIVGISGLLLDLGTLIIFKEFFGIAPVVAVLFNQLIVVVYNFCLNKYWSFKNKEMPHKQLVRYLMVMGLNYLVGSSVMYIFNHMLDFDYRIVRLVTVAVMVPANFLLYKYWVYRRNVTRNT